MKKVGPSNAPNNLAQAAGVIPRWDKSVSKFIKTRAQRFNLYPVFLKDGIVLSAGGHAIVALLLIIAPYIKLNYTPFRPKENIITVDLNNLIIPPDVKIEKETVIPKAAPAKAEPKKEAAPAQAPAPTPAKAEAPTPAAKPEAPKPMAVAPVKDIPLPKMGEEEIKKTLAEAAPPKRDALDDILASVNEIAKERKQVKKGIEAADAPPPSSASVAEAGQASAAGEQLRSHMALSYIDAVRLKLRSCWNIDPGAKGFKDMKIMIRTAMSEDGNITSLSILNAREFRDDPWFKAAAASARRALLTCAPYTNLPADLHHEWKDIVFTFYPNGEIR